MGRCDETLLVIFFLMSQFTVNTVSESRGDMRKRAVGVAGQGLGAACIQMEAGGPHTTELGAVAAPYR